MAAHKQFTIATDVQVYLCDPQYLRRYFRRQMESSDPWAFQRPRPSGAAGGEACAGAIFEADFLPCSYGYRPKQSQLTALEPLRNMLDADIATTSGIVHDQLRIDEC